MENRGAGRLCAGLTCATVVAVCDCVAVWLCDCDVGCAERCDHVAAVTVGLEHDCVTVFAANSAHAHACACACDSDSCV